jgi:hypothetical protein
LPAEVEGVLLPVLFLCGLGVFWWLLARSRELFRISIRDGKQTVARGYAPVGLLNDFGSAVRRVKHGTIKAYKSEGGARLSFGGDIDRDAQQRLRNMLSLYPVARLRSPHIDKRQAVSDAFNVAWLLSLLRSLFR